MLIFSPYHFISTCWAPHPITLSPAAELFTLSLYPQLLIFSPYQFIPSFWYSPLITLSLAADLLSLSLYPRLLIFSPYHFIPSCWAPHPITLSPASDLLPFSLYPYLYVNSCIIHVKYEKLLFKKQILVMCKLFSNIWSLKSFKFHNKLFFKVVLTTTIHR